MNSAETDPFMGAGLKQTKLNTCQQLPSPKEQNQTKTTSQQHQKD